MSRFARTALRWGLLGGAGCVLSWCGLTTAAGTAQAASGDGHPLTVIQNRSLERLVDDVDAVTTDLTEITRVPGGAGDAPAAEPESTQPAEDEHQAAKDAKHGDSLGTGIDRLTELATSLDRIGAPVRAENGSTSTPPQATEGGGVDEPVDVQAPAEVAAVSDDVTTADASAQEPSANADGPSRRTSGGQSERTAHVATSATSIYPPVGVAAGGTGDGNTPVNPVDPRAFTSSTTSSSSTGNTALDGGSGARVVAFRLPYAAKSATELSRTGVEVPWNAAGKPRVSPD